VQTEAWAEPADLTVQAGSVQDGHTYVPTKPRLVRAWLDALPVALLERSTFVDMGSGRGRVLLMAAERPFRRVVGVEFATELHLDAQENLRRFPSRRMRCTDVTSVLGDAAAFRLPNDPLVVYFDNPFSEQIMSIVVENLRTSYAEAPRPMVVVFQQLVHEAPGTSTDNMLLLDQQPFLLGRTLKYRLRDRPFLSPFVVRIYATAEAASLDR
jgi:16S rRNA G966 N2-methylase RsmD